MHQFVSYALLAISLAALAYGLVALWRVLAFGQRVDEFDRMGRDARADLNGRELPAITILKPVAGLEAGLYENLSSFCAQDYPQFQVVFGAATADDPARAVIDDVTRAFPARSIASVVGTAADAPNLKVAQLMVMVEAADHDVLVVADSDTNVGPRYLHAVAAALRGERVGAVTCVYRGVPKPGLASALGALMINDQFIPSVLVAAGGTMRFCLGATMAVTRSTLDAIGGFAALSRYLADDQMLGALVSRQGSRVVLAPCIVGHVVDEPGFGALWAHELRWARTKRAARPWGYAGYFLTFAWPPALIYLLISGDPLLGGVLLGSALALRLALHYAVRAALGVRTPDALWLVPLSDALSLGAWAASFFGRGVRWRDRALRIDAAGKITGAAG